MANMLPSTTTTPINGGTNANNLGRRSSRSRRGSMYLNFANMSLSPLTTINRTPADADSSLDNGMLEGGSSRSETENWNRNQKVNLANLRNGSYIETVSAPTTPGILSMYPNPSGYFNSFQVQSRIPITSSPARSGHTTPRPRRNSSNKNNDSPSHATSLAVIDSGLLPPRKSKSVGQLTSLASQAPYSSNSQPSTPSSYYSVKTNMSMTSLSRPATGMGGRRSKSREREREREKDAYWMHRTGAFLTSESREFKGQSWLVSRASSTSLMMMDYEELEDKMITVSTPQSNSNNSGSYLHFSSSSRPKYTVSINGGREEEEFYDIGSEFDTPIGRRTPRSPRSEETCLPLPSSGGAITKGDGQGNDTEGFCEADYESENDDLDRYYSKDRSFGLRGLIDRIIGWSLFSFEDSEEEAQWERKHQEQEVGDLRKADIERTGTLQVRNMGMERKKMGGEEADELNSWGDPAWFFAIAAKVFF